MSYFIDGYRPLIISMYLYYTLIIGSRVLFQKKKTNGRAVKIIMLYNLQLFNFFIATNLLPGGTKTVNNTVLM